jgi:FixJ family two-component response regulator
MAKKKAAKKRSQQQVQKDRTRFFRLLPENERKVVKYLVDISPQWQSAGEIAVAVGIARRTVERACSQLIGKRLIGQMGTIVDRTSNPVCYYFLPEDYPELL